MRRKLIGIPLAVRLERVRRLQHLTMARKPFECKKNIRILGDSKVESKWNLRRDQTMGRDLIIRNSEIPFEQIDLRRSLSVRSPKKTSMEKFKRDAQSSEKKFK